MIVISTPIKDLNNKDKEFYTTPNPDSLKNMQLNLSINTNNQLLTDANSEKDPRQMNHIHPN